MTTYTFNVNSSITNLDWSNTAIWVGGVVPGGPDADVVIPEIKYANSRQPYVSGPTVASQVKIRSLSITDNSLSVNANMTIDGELSTAGAQSQVNVGAVLSVGSCDNAGGSISGWGAINCSGAFTNQAVLDGDGMHVTAASFNNTGALAALSGGDLTLTVNPGGFANLSNSTLTGGDYLTSGTVLYLNVGGLIATDAAYISLGGGGDVRSYDSAKSAFEPIETTLQAIAPTGVLQLGSNSSFSWNTPLQDGGLLLLEKTNLTTPQLTIGKGAQLMGLGEVSGPIVDNGTIVVGLSTGVAPGWSGGTLELSGPVTGTGSALIAQGQYSGGEFWPWTLQLDGATALNVQFAAADGLLLLKDPSGYAGTITPHGAGDQIEFAGVGLSSVTGYSYAGGTAGGTLTIDLGSSKIALKFAGDLDTQDFTLAAGPQTLSTDPPSLMITISDGAAATTAAKLDVERDNFAGPSEILISNTNGDVVVGHVNGGSIDRVQIDNFQEAYTRISGLGPEWTFRAAGDFMGDGYTDFLIQNTNGALVVGEANTGTVKYTALSLGLGTDWTFHGSGNFLSLDRDQILVEQKTGAVDAYDPWGGNNALTQIGALGPEWKIVAVGDYLGDYRSQFLIENTAGTVVMGTVSGGKASYSVVGGLGPEWKFVGDGHVLGDGKDQFLIQNSSGVVVAGEIGSGGKAQYTALGALGPEWTFKGVADYLQEGHDQFVIENANGAVVIGDYVGGQIHYTQVGALGPEWSFHD